MQSSTFTYSVVWLHQALERAITYLYLKGFIGWMKNFSETKLWEAYIYRSVLW